MYLGKPVLMVPVEGHMEQACNARDFAALGAGIDDQSFRLDRLIDFIPRYNLSTQSYRQWVHAAERLIMEQIWSVAAGPGDTVTPVIRMPDGPPSQAAVV
jgi:hypothetical protein